MSVRVSDVIETQNNQTSFPVAYGKDLWIDKNKGIGNPNYSSIQNMFNNDELGGDGSTIQVDVMPVGDEYNVGKIYQYVGENGTYKKGHFYECIYNHINHYLWKEVDHFRFNHTVYSSTTPPINSDYIAGDIIYYVGTTTDNFTSGHYYRALPTTEIKDAYTFSFLDSVGAGVVYWSYVPFEYRLGFLVRPTGSDGEWNTYEITEINENGITISPYGFTGQDIHYFGVDYVSIVRSWEDLGGGGGGEVAGIIDVQTLPSSDVKNTFYRTDDFQEINFVYTDNTIENIMNVLSHYGFSQGDVKYNYITTYGQIYNVVIFLNNLNEVYTSNNNQWNVSRIYIYKRTNTNDYNLGYYDYNNYIDNRWTVNTSCTIGLRSISINAGKSSDDTMKRIAMYDESTRTFNGLIEDWKNLTVDKRKRYNVVNIKNDISNVSKEYIRNPEWNKYIEININNSSGSYTVPKDGIFIATRIVGTATNAITTFTVNDVVSFTVGTLDGVVYGGTNFQVNKNDIISWTNVSTSSAPVAYFVPYKKLLAEGEVINHTLYL